MKLLFITADGIQNYLESLFLPTLSKIQNENIAIEVLEFCPKDKEMRDSIVNSSKLYNIPVYFGTYFNKPPVIGSFLFILYGAFRTMGVVKNNNIDTLMPRSLLAGAMALLAKLFYRKLDIIYESDGLMSDERVDFGSWSRTGLIYKIFQAIEKKLVRDSKKVITRTQKAKDILIERSPGVDSQKIVVIPNAKNSHVFKPISSNKRTDIRDKYGISKETLLLIYVGSIGPQYRPDIMLKIFTAILKDNRKAKFLILTPNKDAMNEVISESSFISSHIIIDKVNPNEIANYIAASDIGLALREPAFSQQGVCPLKVIEYLMCGIPVISNSGVGDMDDIFKNNHIGYIIDDLDNVSIDKIMHFINMMSDGDKEKIKENNRNVALKYFDLDTVDKKYRNMIEREV